VTSDAERTLPLGLSTPTFARRRAVVKDVVERPEAAVALVLLAPLIALVALLIKLTSRGPVFHRRRVVGQYGSTFNAFKFRTMVANADDVLVGDPTLRAAFEVKHKLPDDPRVTRVGRILRKYSFDELPQLLNVVRGEMSLVGPRMIAPEELAKYGDRAGKLMSVKPGITGLWQVSGRQTTSYAERVTLDMHYIDHWSLATDLAILCRTLAVVLSAKGAY